MVQKQINLVGETYGRLKVLKEVEQDKYHRRYLCECQCGNHLIVRQNNLRNGNTTSCGCFRKETTRKILTVDLTGQRFHKLTVIENTGKTINGNFIWKCQCDCGNITEVKGNRLQNGTTKSCGCLKETTGERVQTYHKKHSFNQGVYTPALRQKTRITNTTGVKRKKGIKYQATITIKYKQIYLGTFDTIEDAKRAREKAEWKYHKPYLNK